MQAKSRNFEKKSYSICIFANFVVPLQIGNTIHDYDNQRENTGPAESSG